MATFFIIMTSIITKIYYKRQLYDYRILRWVVVAKKRHMPYSSTRTWFHNNCYYVQYFKHSRFWFNNTDILDWNKTNVFFNVMVCTTLRFTKVNIVHKALKLNKRCCHLYKYYVSFQYVIEVLIWFQSLKNTLIPEQKKFFIYENNIICHMLVSLFYELRTSRFLKPLLSQ